MSAAATPEQPQPDELWLDFYRVEMADLRTFDPIRCAVAWQADEDFRGTSWGTIYQTQPILLARDLIDIIEHGHQALIEAREFDAAIESVSRIAESLPSNYVTDREAYGSRNGILQALFWRLFQIGYDDKLPAIYERGKDTFKAEELRWTRMAAHDPVGYRALISYQITRTDLD